MTTDLELPHGAWWRFDAYEVSGGCVRPRRGARLERYDPWREYAACLGSQGDRTTRGANRVYPGLPYSELLERMHAPNIHLTNKRPELHFADPATEAAVLDWVSHFGLLGVLPHSCEAATMPLQQGERRGGSTLPVSRHYQRTPEGWELASEAHIPDDWSTGGATLEDIEEWMTTRPGAVLPEWYIRSLEGGWPDFYRRGALMREPPIHQGSGGPDHAILQPQHLTLRPLSEAWAPYFPEMGQKDSGRTVYPLPLSEEFWRGYGEPLDEFANWCRILRRAVVDPGDALGRRLLHALVQPVTPSVLRTAAGLRQAWLSPSLLASLAMMALLDQTEGRQTHVCASCGKLFVSDAYQVEYCGDRCRFRVQKRRLRGRQREAVERHARGESVEQIARALETAPETVGGWLAKTGATRRKAKR